MSKVVMYSPLPGDTTTVEVEPGMVERMELRGWRTKPAMEGEEKSPFERFTESLDDE